MVKGICIYDIPQAYLNLLLFIFYCYCEDNVKYGPLLNPMFQRTQQHGGWSSSYHMEENTFIEARYTNNTHTAENGFAVTTFECLWVHFVSERVKKMFYTLICMIPLHIQREEETKWMLFMRRKFGFLHVQI